MVPADLNSTNRHYAHEVSMVVLMPDEFACTRRVDITVRRIRIDVGGIESDLAELLRDVEGVLLVESESGELAVRGISFVVLDHVANDPAVVANGGTLRSIELTGLFLQSLQ